MAVRSTMATLITRVRVLIADPLSVQFNDQTVQDYLDKRRAEIWYALLDPRPTFNAGGGTYNYSDYFSDLSDWEDDVSLVDTAYNPLTPATSDTLVGHWTFVNPPNGQYPPVRALGKVYDCYGSAADLLDQWAAALALQFNFSASGASYNVSQKYDHLVEQAQRYRMQAKPGYAALTKSDENATAAGIGYSAWYDDPNNV